MANRPMRAVVGVLWLLSALFLVYVTWDWIVTFIQALDDDFVKVCFWVGYFGLFLTYGIYVPYHLIISTDSEEQQ